MIKEISIMESMRDGIASDVRDSRQRKTLLMENALSMIRSQNGSQRKPTFSG